MGLPPFILSSQMALSAVLLVPLSEYTPYPSDPLMIQMPNVTPTHLHELWGGRHLDIFLEIPLSSTMPIAVATPHRQVTDLLLSLNLRNSAQRCENTGLWEQMVHNRDKGRDIQLYLTPRTPTVSFSDCPHIHTVPW